MRIGGHSGYGRVRDDTQESGDFGRGDNESQENNALIEGNDSDVEFDNELDNADMAHDSDPDTSELPLEPPQYNNDDEEMSQFITPTVMEQMDMDDPLASGNSQDVPITDKIGRFFTNINDHFVNPMRVNVVDPLAQGIDYVSEVTDFYLNKIGNPLILRRFFYIIVMSFIVWIIVSSGFLPNKRSTHSRGIFTDYNILMDYARKSFDLSKLEKDLEYISSMPHMSGTQGDTAVRHYIEENFNNNGLKLVKELEYRVYANYPGNASLNVHRGKNNDKEFHIDMNKDNFNAMSANGSLHNIDVIYGFKGRDEDLKKLQDAGMLSDNYVLLLQYDTLPSEQMLLAQKYNAKGVLFVSPKFEGDDGNTVLTKSVGIPQYAPGDPLTPGWFGNAIDPIDPKKAKGLPQIPSLPLSYNQGHKLLKVIQQSGVKFDDNQFSGVRDDIKIDMVVDTAIRESHSITDIIGKIEGREQTDKAIIIVASRGTVHNGALYPSFGSAVLLSLLQLFQEVKYKYDWKPLRNIYFMSYGGSEFNYAGSTELIDERLSMLKDEIYNVVDISELGIWDKDKKISIESHPVLHRFFNEDGNKMGFDVNVEHVHHYGDWLPFLAHGIPVSIFSSPRIREKDFPIDTNKDTFEAIASSMRSHETGEIATDLLTYLFRTCLELVDTPLLPFHIDDYVQIMDKAVRDFGSRTEHKLRFDSIVKGLLLWKRIGMEWSNWRRAWEQLVLEHEEGIEPSLIAVHRWTWNKKLSNLGRRQCMASGLPNRPFYKNVLFSPPIWSKGEHGPDSWLFPGIQDAINDNDWAAAQQQLNEVGKIMEYSANVFIEETNDVGF